MQTNLVWTDAELDESMVTLCDEFPAASMAACSRVLEHCRRTVSRETPDLLLTAMRQGLREEITSSRGDSVDHLATFPALSRHT